jgi:uncharacterized RDD family membrane protein YckC
MTGSEPVSPTGMSQPPQPPQSTQPAQPPPAGWAPPPVTEPGPMPGLRYAGFWVRTAAYLIDGVVVAAIFFVAVMIDAAIGAFTLTLLAWVASIVYLPFFWVRGGQTPGMRPFGLRVVRDRDGGPVGVGTAILRYVGLIVGTVPLYLGLIWVAFDARKQGWHDKIAGTVVVRPA